MTETSPEQTLDSLDVFVGEWSMRSSLAPDPASAPRARTTFEWLSGRQFLVQRWEVEHPDAPDGIAIIGFDADKTALLQHYFDSRGTARVYRMTFADKVWTLYASAAVPEFSQRFTGTLEDDTIVGRWETSSDGTNWNLDFDLIYTRVP
ncbi:MAG: DUF1579 family protein [Gaiellaceae bacterium]